MKKFEKMSDKKLKRWLYLYEVLSITRIIMSETDYKEAITESFSRFRGDEMCRYYYFTYINKDGNKNDYKRWSESY